MRAVALAPLLALAPTIHGLEFTGPSTDEKLNLAAPITISWEKGLEGADRDWTELSIWRRGVFGTGGGFGYSLAENLTASETGSFVWDPASVTAALAGPNNSLSDGKDFYFEAKVRQAGGGARGSTSRSDKYAVEGCERIGSYASAVRPVWGAVGLGLLAMGFLS